MPLLTMNTQSGNKSVNDQSIQQRPRLLHASSNRHDPNRPITLNFLVTDENGEEQTVIAKVDCTDLFYQTQEGNQWAEQQQQVSQIRSRRSA